MNPPLNVDNMLYNKGTLKIFILQTLNVLLSLLLSHASEHIFKTEGPG